MTDTPTLADAINETCPWSGKPVAEDSLTTYTATSSASATPAAATNSRPRLGISRRR